METCKIDGCPHIASNFSETAYALCLAHYDNFMCTPEFREAADYVEVMNRKPAIARADVCKVNHCEHEAGVFTGTTFAMCLKHHADSELMHKDARQFIADSYAPTPTPKKNAGKPKPRYLDPHFLEAICRAMSWGETKYPANNYLSLDSEELYDSMLRHLLEIRKDNKTDSESGLDHMDHFVANVMMWFAVKRKEGEK